ncbi:MAG: MFS transporter [Clostridia bacterium]|nr:MFS transporter [Clostridia bacterium]
MNNWKRNLFIMWLAQLSGMMTITFIMSFIPIYVAELGITEIHSKGFWAGILMGASAFFASFTGPIWGNVADRYGRKIMVERVLFSNAILTLLMAFAANVWQFLILRSIQGILGGFVSAAIALVTSFTPKEKVGAALGFFQNAMIVGSTLGPLLGGILVDAGGFQLAFLVMALFSLSAGLLVHFLVKEPFITNSAKINESFWGSFRYLLSLKGLVALCLVNFLVQFGTMIVLPIVPTFLKVLDPSVKYLATLTGIIIALGGVFAAISAALIGRLSDRYGHRRMLLIMTSGAAITFLATAGVTSISQFIFLRILSGILLGGMLPTTNAMINSLIPADRRGTAFGITSSFGLLGNVVGPITGGILPPLVTYRGVFMVTALLIFTAAWWVARNSSTQSRLSQG